MNKFFIHIVLLCCFSLGAVAQETLSEIRVDEFEARALEKAKDLGVYIKIIADKNTPRQDAQDAIELAVDLFVDENRQVQVSSLSRKSVNTYPVRQYFNRLQLLQYSNVQVEWYDVHKVSDIRLGTDGKYYGAITIYQRFRGSTGDGVTYADVTEKTIEVILDRIVKNVGGTTVNTWDVYLGDIKVVETQGYK